MLLKSVAFTICEQRPVPHFFCVVIALRAMRSLWCSQADETPKKCIAKHFLQWP
jgi:hypothetical protein